MVIVLEPLPYEVEITEEPLTEEQLDMIELLQKMRDILEGHWCPVGGGYPTADGASTYCVITSIHKAVDPSYWFGKPVNTWSNPLKRKVRHLLEGILGVAPGTVANWNDSPNTSHKDVMNLIDRAIEEVRKWKNVM